MASLTTGKNQLNVLNNVKTDIYNDLEDSRLLLKA